MNKFVFASALVILLAGLLVMSQLSLASPPFGVSSISQALCSDVSIIEQGGAAFGYSQCNNEGVNCATSDGPAGRACTPFGSTTCRQYGTGACVYRCQSTGTWNNGASCTSGYCADSGRSCRP